MANEDKGKTNGGIRKVSKSRNTTMKSVASTLAVMFIEDTLKKGGEIDFPSLGIKLTKEDLLGPASENGNGHDSKEK